MAKSTITVLYKNGIKDLFPNINAAIDPDRLAEQASAVLLNRIRTRFLSEQDTEGNKWPPSKRALALGANGHTLFETGTLFHSIQEFKNGEGEVAIGTDVPYAPQHQEGQFGLPVREFLGISGEDENVVVKLIELRIKQRLGQ